MFAFPCLLGDSPNKVLPCTHCPRGPRDRHCRSPRRPGEGSLAQEARSLFEANQLTLCLKLLSPWAHWQCSLFSKLAFLLNEFFIKSWWYQEETQATTGHKVSLQVHCFALPAHFYLASIFQYIEDLRLVRPCYQDFCGSSIPFCTFTASCFTALCMTVESSTCEKQFHKSRQSVPQPPPSVTS